VNHHCLIEQVRGLQEWVLHYEETFEQAPKGYTLNDECIPHFRIPTGNGLYCPAKWIKLNDDGTVSGYADTNGPSSQPHIINLYAQPNDDYDSNSEAVPALPILAWFQLLIVGPASNFYILHHALLTHNDWGLTYKVNRYHNLNDEYADLAIQLEHLQIELNAIQNACAACKSHLMLTYALEQVETLKNILYKPQATCSVWKHKSTGHGCPF